MKFAKVTACLLALLLLLSSCGLVVLNRGNSSDDTDPSDSAAGTDSETEWNVTFPPYETYPSVTDADHKAEARDRLAELPSVDMGGSSVFFALAEESGSFFDEEEGRYLSSVNLRNEMVRSKYNVRLIVTKERNEVILQQVADAKKSGNFYSDFAVIAGTDLGDYLTAKHLMNLNTLPFADYEADYYDQAAMEQLTLGGVVYGAVGDATKPYENYVCVYVNKSHVAPDYTAIREGSFTWDALLASLEGLPEGVLGAISTFDAVDTAAFSYVGAGGHFLAETETNSLRLACTDPVSQALAARFRVLFERDQGLSDDVEDAFSLFTQGNAAYAFATLGDMERLANVGFTWEVLPLPKRSEDLPYATPMMGDSPVIVALITSPNIDTMGHILNAVNAASGDYFFDKQYDDAFDRLVSGIYTLDMIDLVRENPVYDMGLLLGGSNKAVRDGTVDAFYRALRGNNAFTSYFDGKTKELNRYLDGLT